jgi:hypothetical protein
MNIIRLAVLALLCVVNAGNARAEENRVRPIESYVSPPQLFPEEMALRAPYVPMRVFDRPEGKAIGLVVAELTPCPPPAGDQLCAIPQAWHVELANGRRVELHHEMVGYDQDALVSYRPTIFKKGLAWSHIEFEGGAFWIRTAAKDVSNYEAHASWAENIDTWCKRPGQCADLSPAMRKELERVAAGEFKLQSISQQAYQIDGIVKHGGRRYYKVSLSEADAGSRRPALPKTGYIPTRRKDGTHVGQFSPKGC